jgi:hypothetical protein
MSKRDGTERSNQSNKDEDEQVKKDVTTRDQLHFGSGMAIVSER